MKKLIGVLLLSLGNIDTAFADAGSHDYSTNIFAGGDASWYANTMALPSLPNNQQNNYQNNNSGNSGYNYSDDDNSGNYQSYDDNNCDCSE